MKQLQEFAATLIDPIDRENLLQLRAYAISTITMIERALGLQSSILKREDRRKIERWAGVSVEEILSDGSKDVL